MKDKQYDKVEEGIIPPTKEELEYSAEIKAREKANTDYFTAVPPKGDIDEVDIALMVALGGEEELIKTIKHVQSLGYKITCHTNTADHYEIASTFRGKDLAKRRDGSTYSHGNWAGGQSFASCPETQLRYAKEDLPKIAALGFKGLHYIDCLSICKPDPCFDEEHPVTVGEAIRYYGKIMALSTEYIGGFSSEGCVDSTHGALDFSLYNCFRDRNASITVSSGVAQVGFSRPGNMRSQTTHASANIRNASSQPLASALIGENSRSAQSIGM
jgi:hypothetical protein